VAIDLSSIGDNPVELRVTNGNVHLSLPQGANANLLATVTNGRIETRQLSLTPFGEQGPRRVRGRLNAGGTPVEVSAVNGTVTIESR
jgi:hypothetical protein